jgi:hypothetical protein
MSTSHDQSRLGRRTSDPPGILNLLKYRGDPLSVTRPRHKVILPIEIRVLIETRGHCLQSIRHDDSLYFGFTA